MEYNEENNIMMEEDFQAQEEIQKINKSKQVYKDTITLIKLKMGKADTLIRQYNDKMKECDLLNEELAVLKNDKENALKKYNQTMEKLTRIELSNSNYKESLETLKNLSENQKIKLDENDKHINQLLFKIKDVEQHVATLQEHNKTLEQEHKSAKVAAKIATKTPVKLKHQGSQTLILKTQEISINTDPIVTSSPEKIKMKDKSVATDKNSCSKNEPFPIFCSKCEVLIEPAPIDQILKIMSFKPPLLSEYHSPPNSPNQNTLNTQVFEPTEIPSLNVTKKDENIPDPVMFIKKKLKSSMKVSKEIENSSFMEIDSLNRKISKLEDLMKKVKKNKRKKENCCHQNCCSSKKNIKFVVQLPNQKEILEYRKRKKSKQQNFKMSKKRQNINDNNWKIESCSELKKKRKLSNNWQGEKKLKKKKLLNQESNNLFEYEKDLFSDDELMENYNSSVKSLSPSNLLGSHLDSSSSNENVETNLDLAEKPIKGVNINQLTIKSKIVSSMPGSSQTSLCSATCSSNLEKENKMSETSPALNKISEKNEVFSSDCNVGIRIENKNTNVQLIRINSKENLENSLMPQVLNKISNVTNCDSVEQGKVFFTQNEFMKYKNKLPNVHEQFPDEEDNSLLSTKCMNDNFTCRQSDKDSEKFSSDASNKNILFDQLSYGSTTNNIEQTRTNLENRHENVDDKGNFHLACKESIKLKTLDSENKNQSSVYIEPPVCTDLSTIQKSQQKVHTCSKTPMDSNLLIESANKELITDNWLSNLQIENTKQDISNDEIEYNNNNDNALVSEESSEECTQSPSISKSQILNRTAKKSSKVTQKKKLLKIIRNIKKSSKRPISVNKLESSVSQVIDKSRNALIESLDNSRSAEPTKQQTSTTENVSANLPTKKQRIAHTPKSLTSANLELKSSSITENFESKVYIENTVISKNQERTSNDNIFSLLEDRHKTCKEKSEIEKSLKTLDLATSDLPVLSDVNEYITKESANEHETEITTNRDNCLLIEDFSLRDLSQDLETNESQESLIIDKNYSDNVNEKSFIEKDNETQVNKLVNEQDIEEAGMKDEENNPTRELRSRQVIVNKDSLTTKAKKLTKYQSCPKAINTENTCLTNSIIVTSLNEFITNFNSNTGTNKRRKVDIKENKSNEKFTEEQLQLLMQAEWTMDMNSKIVETLLDSLDIKTLAFFLIEFAAEKIVENEEFDKLHTPPAPMMTPSEQKLVVLILSISKIHREFENIIIEGIRFKLFKLGKPQMVQVVERLFRILVVLNKIKKDREKVRIFLCDALYCLNMRAINVIYVALTCWSEVLPKYSPNNDILVKTIVHIVMTLEASAPFSKLRSLKKLLSTYYEYPSSGYKTLVLKDELLKKLQENADGVNTAVLLLCKKMGPTWSMENIIKGGLKQMIVTQIHPSLYEALNLLGNILRSSPKTDSSNNVGEIVDQLCDVLASNAGSDDLQEGVLSCLLSISKFNYEKIAEFVMKWQPNKKDLQDTTKEKLNSFFKSQGAKWWWQFVNTNFPLCKIEL